ncbi:hypothetical protein, partial [Salmonella enterica]|uniref:hypothetical protein n=1 Tax=Salmonella enterica TaxID=28901 RepID=UPI001BB0C153
AALINSGLIDETGTHLTPEGAKLVYDYLEPVLEIGHRQSIGNGGVYQQHNNLYVYTVAGDRSKGLIDNYPY